MTKQFWVTIVSILLLSATAAQAQWRITTANGEEYIGVFIGDDQDTLSLRTLDNIAVRIRQDRIKITEKMKTRMELKNKGILIGHVNNINEEEMTLLTDGAGEIIIPLSSVLKMKAVNNDGSDYYSPEDDQDQVDPDPEIEGGYPMAGAIIGYPSIAKILVGYQGDDFGFRIDGMSHTVGTTIRLNFLMNISKYKNFENNVSLGLGLWSLKETSEEPPEAFFLFGAWYDFNSHGFFLEAGAFVITEDYTPTFSLHLGYVYRFNRK